MWRRSGWAGDEAALLQKNRSSLGVPGPQPSFPCNKEGIMLFLILYLPRVPMIFFLSESNFLLTFLPDVAKHDLCKRTWLAACFLPGAPQISWKALCLFLSWKGARLPGAPGPVLPSGWLVPTSSLFYQRCALSGTYFSRLCEHEVPAGCQCSAFEASVLFNGALKNARN